MPFGDLTFRFRWSLTLLLVLLMTLFIGLGLWQMDRAAGKRVLAEELRARAELPAAPVGGMVTDTEPLRFRKLIAEGVYESDGQILLEGRRYSGHNGFHVVTPLHIAGSDLRVLVNRGWISADSAGLPGQAPIPDGPVTAMGETHVPEPPAIVLHGGPEAAAAWGTRWPYLTMDLYREAFDFPVQPMVILLDPGADGGFVRSWPRELPKEGMHIGYALQWFAFAVIALVIYLRFSLERRHTDGEL